MATNCLIWSRPFCSLGVDDLADVLDLLQRCGFPETKWHQLGLRLGLKKNTLDAIEKNHPHDVSRCMTECLSQWLGRADNVDSRGGTNLDSLSNALQFMNETAVAEKLKHHATFIDIFNNHHTVLSQSLCDSVGIAWLLYAERMLTQEAVSRVVSASPSIPNQREALLTAVKEAVQTDPNSLHAFVNVLCTISTNVSLGQAILDDISKYFTTPAEVGMAPETVFKGVPQQDITSTDNNKTTQSGCTDTEIISNSSSQPLSPNSSQVKVSIPQYFYEEYSTIRGSYTRMLYNVCKLLQRKLNVDDIKEFLSCYSSSLRKKVEHCSDISSILCHVKDECSLTNIELLHSIVKEMKITEAEEHIKTYKAELEKFYESIPISLCLNKKIDSVSHLQCETVTLVFDWKPEEHVLEEIKCILSKVSRKLLRIQYIEPSESISVTCSFPLSDVGFTVLRMIENIHILMGQGLKKLTIGNLTLWRRQDDRLKELKEKDQDLLQLTEVISYIILEKAEYRLRNAIRCSSKEKEESLSVQSDTESIKKFEKEPLYEELTALRSQFNKIHKENEKLCDKLLKMKIDLRSLYSSNGSAASEVRRAMSHETDDCKFNLKAMTRPDYQPLVDNKREIEKLQERISLMNMELIPAREHNEKIIKDIKDCEEFQAKEIEYSLIRDQMEGDTMNKTKTHSVGSASSAGRETPCEEPGKAMSSMSKKFRDPFDCRYTLISKIMELKDHFDDALRLTEETFLKLPVAHVPEIIEYLSQHLCNMLGPISFSSVAHAHLTTRPVFREKFIIKTMADLFKTLEYKYVSWFNYELIVKLVCVFLSKIRTLKGIWSQYEEKLKDYFINSSGLWKDADTVLFGIGDVPPGTRVMIVKVEREDYILDDLFFFRRAIAKGLGIPECNLHFRSIHLSSLCLSYLIPEYLYPLLFPLTQKLQQQLASIGITELTCGEDKYDIREFSIEEVKYSSTDIDICDPLWCENTSTPLHEAAWRGLKEEVQWLLNEFSYDTYCRGLNGWTPLHSASYGGHIEILQLLIYHQYCIDPNEGDDNSVSSIHMASYKGHLSIVQYLVDTCHVPPDQPDNSNNTALLYSAMGGHSDVVEFLINRKCDTSKINREGASLSLLACQSGELALVQKLESLNLFLPDSKDIYGGNVLHYCSMNNRSVELIKYLLNRYQLSIGDGDHRFAKTPLHYASWYASSSVVEYILSIQGNEALLVTNNRDISCLHCACDVAIHIPAGVVYSKLMAQRDAPVIQIINRKIKQNIDFMKRKERVKMFSSLLERASFCPNFDINKTTNTGQSLLHLAACSGSTLLVKALEKYSITSTLNNQGMSPVHNAAWSGSTSILSYIISQYKLNANDTDTDGRTSLVYSCWAGSITSVKYLINNYNSDPNTTDNDGMTCLHHSCRNGHINVAQYLIEELHCDIHKTDNEGRTLVHHAASSGDFDLVKYLITEKGLSLFAVDKNGLTAIRYASQQLFNLSLVEDLSTTYQVDHDDYPWQLDPRQASSDFWINIWESIQFAVGVGHSIN